MNYLYYAKNHTKILIHVIFDVEQQNLHIIINYICITDNPYLKSKTWKIIVDTKNIDSSWSPRKKTYFVRYHPFNYCNSDYCYWIDSAIKILNVDFENISKNDLIYFHGIEIKTYIKESKCSKIEIISSGINYLMTYK